MAQQQVSANFKKGINERVNIERGDPQRLHRLSNARLQERGDTLQVSRIQGYQYIENSTTVFDVIYDSLFYQNDLVVYWYDTNAGEAHITFIDIDDGSETNLSFADTQVSYGEIELLEDNIYLTPYDKQVNNINGTWFISDFISTVPTIDVDDVAGGNLESLTYYWYKVRAVYNDGHKTITCYPEFRYTDGGDTTIEVTINDIPEDLDGDLVDIEVFRKKDGGDWFLIERITPATDPFVYTDDGKTTISPLDERNYVWSNNPLTQDIVRDRLVRANLEYQNKFLGWEEDDVNFFSSVGGNYEETSLPKNTSLDIYGQGRYNDGTVTPHVYLDTIEIGGESERRLVTNPQTQPSNVDNLKEVSYFGKFMSNELPEIAFSTFEIYNQNIASLATTLETDEADQDKPLTPHVFLGYKYVQFISNTEGDEIGRVFDEDWSYNFGSSSYNGTPDSVNRSDDVWSDASITDFSHVGDDLIKISFTNSGDINVYETSEIVTDFGVHTYKLKYENIEGGNARYVYELALVEPLKEAVNQGKIQINLSNTIGGDRQFSTVHNQEEFESTNVDIVGILDTSTTRTKVQEHNVTGKNHVYLVLDQDSIYSDVDNESLNNEDILAEYGDTTGNDNLPSFEYTIIFDLIGVENVDFGGTTTRSTYDPEPSYDEVTVDYGLREFSPVTEPSDQALYLGTQDEFDEDNLTNYFDYFNGYSSIKTNLFEYQTQLEASIFENLITEDDLNQFQEDYSNQLVWGGPHILESNASGVRDFEFTNFKNISENYGEIVRIAYINNVLFVFCERGVNQINVGEVLTQQTGGQVFVDSSRFLNNDIWILKNIPDVKPRSVRQYENLLFFCDGKDVWKYDSSPQNITNGRINLDVDTDYIGHIDPKNKEYLLSNGNESYSYAIELDEWQGPYTFAPHASSTYRDNYYGVIDDEATEFNIGNTFGGTDYETVIESVANIANAPQITKLFRKFYIETEGDGTFSYAKNYGDWTDKVLSNYPTKNGLTHIGVNPVNKNGRQIYWKIVSNIQDFILQQVSWLYEPRKRR